MPTRLNYFYSKSKCQEIGCLKEWRYNAGNKYYCREHYLKMLDNIKAIEKEVERIKRFGR